MVSKLRLEFGKSGWKSKPYIPLHVITYLPDFFQECTETTEGCLELDKEAALAEPI